MGGLSPELRSQDVDERIEAERALKNFGRDALTIHLSLAKASMEVGMIVDGQGKRKRHNVMFCQAPTTSTQQFSSISFWRRGFLAIC